MLKGRGSLSNKESRFVKSITEPVDDGWNTVQLERADKIPTQLFVDKTRQLTPTILQTDPPNSAK